MKNLRFIFVLVFLATTFAVSTFAQTTATNKVYVIDTGAFGDEKEGIKKFIDASKKITLGLETDYKAIQNLEKKMQDSAKQFQTLREQYAQNPTGPVTLEAVQQKADEIEKMETEKKRKEEDLEKALAKRELDILTPIRVDIYKEMNKFAKQKGYPLILDLVQLVETKLILAIGDEKVDVTNEFIQYYNSLPTSSASK